MHKISNLNQKRLLLHIQIGIIELKCEQNGHKKCRIYYQQRRFSQMP